MERHTYDLEELILLKCPLGKAIYRFNGNSLNSNSIFHKNRTILRFVWDMKIANSQSNLEKQEQTHV